MKWAKTSVELAYIKEKAKKNLTQPEYVKELEIIKEYYCELTFDPTPDNLIKNHFGLWHTCQIGNGYTLDKYEMFVGGFVHYYEQYDGYNSLTGVHAPFDNHCIYFLWVKTEIGYNLSIYINPYFNTIHPGKNKPGGGSGSSLRSAIPYPPVAGTDPPPPPSCPPPPRN